MKTGASSPLAIPPTYLVLGIIGIAVASHIDGKTHIIISFYNALFG